MTKAEAKYEELCKDDAFELVNKKDDTIVALQTQVEALSTELTNKKKSNEGGRSGKFIARLGLWQVGTAPISCPLPPCLPHTRQDRRQTKVSGPKSQLRPSGTQDQDLSWKLNSKKHSFSSHYSFASQTEISFSFV